MADRLLLSITIEGWSKVRPSNVKFRLFGCPIFFWMQCLGSHLSLPEVLAHIFMESCCFSKLCVCMFKVDIKTQSNRHLVPTVTASHSHFVWGFIWSWSLIEVKDKNSLNGIVRVCSKIIVVRQRDLGSLWEKQVVQKARRIIAQPDHVLANAFILMPSGQRYVAPPRKTNRYAKSFTPSAISLLKTAVTRAAM